MSLLKSAKFQRFKLKSGDIVQNKHSKALYKVSTGIQFCVNSQPSTDTFYTLNMIENGEPSNLGFQTSKLRIFEDYDIVKVGTLLYD